MIPGEEQAGLDTGSQAQEVGLTHATEADIVLKVSVKGNTRNCSGRVCGQGDQLKAFTDLHVRDDGGLGQE